MRVEWSTPAAADLSVISEHIERDRNLTTANRITEAIYESARSLKSMLFRGRPGRIENTRELVVLKLPCIIIYRISNDRVTIVTIVYGAQKRP